MRTPLNTIVLGIKMLYGLLASGDSETTTSCVQDIEQSVQIALDGVNDMLTHDKIQSNNLMLEKIFLKPWEFFKEAVSPMMIQVRF